MYLHTFLVEAIPFLEPKPAPIKPGKAKDTKMTTTKPSDANQDNMQPSILQHFVQSRKDDSQAFQGEVLENEDGTLSGGGPSEVPA